jgi:glutathione S-transferase
MLTLHHLNDSRSQRILWLLEELGTPYEMKRYQRNATTTATSGSRNPAPLSITSSAVMATAN